MHCASWLPGSCIGQARPSAALPHAFPHARSCLTRCSGLSNVQATQVIDKLIKLVPQYQAYVSFMDTDIVALADW